MKYCPIAYTPFASNTGYYSDLPLRGTSIHEHS